MPAIDFDHDRNSNDMLATYRGLTIRAVHDSHPENPWDAMDGNIPVAVYSDRSSNDPDCLLANPLRLFSDTLLRRHMGKVLQAFAAYDVRGAWGARIDSDASHYVTQEAKERQRDYGGSLTDHKRDLIDECYDSLRTPDQMEVAAELYGILGIPAYATSSNGYCQGHYADLLFVATPEWCKAMGIDAKRHDWSADFESAKRLWASWAWGDCYGFVIESDTGETLDSCFGFYGAPDDRDDWSGIQAAAKESADYILKTAKGRRLQALRTCIANRIPLDKCAAILASAGAPA
jgi:hypothetical protein